MIVTIRFIAAIFFLDIKNENDVTIGAALNSRAVVTGQDALTCPADSMDT